MSTSPARARALGLPAWAAPRNPPGDGRDPAGPSLRMIETAILILVGLVLTVAVAWDVVRQTHVNVRTAADRATWRAYAHRDLHNKTLTVRTLLRGTTDFTCGPPVRGATNRLCLMMVGPTHVSRRTVAGGYYVPLKRQDRFIVRYGCFGLAASRHLCAHRTAPA
jgi:hypothetical protein